MKKEIGPRVDDEFVAIPPPLGSDKVAATLSVLTHCFDILHNPVTLCLSISRLAPAVHHLELPTLLSSIFKGFN